MQQNQNYLFRNASLNFISKHLFINKNVSDLGNVLKLPLSKIPGRIGPILTRLFLFFKNIIEKPVQVLYVMKYASISITIVQLQSCWLQRDVGEFIMAIVFLVTLVTFSM